MSLGLQREHCSTDFPTQALAARAHLHQSKTDATDECVPSESLAAVSNYHNIIVVGIGFLCHTSQQLISACIYRWIRSIELQDRAVSPDLRPQTHSPSKRSRRLQHPSSGIS